MKKINIKYLLYVICGVMTLSSLFSSCKLDDPEPTPTEEIYLREFIKKYGLIDPNQDWNQAEKTKVTVVVDYADVINVFVKYSDIYYRVACFAEVSGTVEIPIDVPEGTDNIYIDVDGRIYITKANSTVDTTQRAPSRADEDYSSHLNVNHPWWESGDDKIRRSWLSIPVESEINCSTYFYKGRSTDDTNADYNYVRPTNVSTTGFSMAVGDEVYAGFHSTLTYVADFILSFETTATDNTILFIKLNGGISETIHLKGSQKHQFILKNFNANGWKEFGIYLAAGALNSISNFTVTELNTRDMAWLMVAEDLGATDDFDFNDVIIRIESLTANKASLKLLTHQWQVIKDDDEHLVLNAPSRGDSRAVDDPNFTKLMITSMCAGGILDSYLHFNNGTTDYVISPGDTTDPEYDLTEASTATGGGEWHTWFTEGTPSQVTNRRNMLNTGLNDASTKSVTIIVPNGFSMSNYSVLYKDYDGTTDSFDGSNYNQNGGSTNWTDSWTYDVGDRIQGFYITVGGPNAETCNNVLTAPKAGRAPQMFLIPDIGAGGKGWCWPMERVPITTVYPRFSNWVKGTDADWYTDAPASNGQTWEKEDKWSLPYWVRQ